MKYPLLLCATLVASSAHAQVDDEARRARAEVAELQPGINQAIDYGMAFLLEEQLMDGSWSTLGDLYPSGSTALCVLALLESGLALDHPAVRSGLDVVVGTLPEETYTAGVQLMALEATRKDTYLRAMEPIVERLLKWRKKGAWSYPADRGADRLVPVKGTIDLSNIQYAALGLRSARFAGYEVPDRVWSDLVREVLKFQFAERDTVEMEDRAFLSPEQRAELEERNRRLELASVGGFRYWSEKHNPFPANGSMTTAGVACLYMAVEALEASGKKGKAGKAQAGIDQGLAWLANNFSVRTNPAGQGGDTRYLYYYLFGLERVGSFLQVDRFGDRFWYLEGAKHLLSAQADDGAWRDAATLRALRPMGADSSAIVDTCFALLFLKRASGRTGENRIAEESHVSDSPQSEVHLRATGSGQMTVWVSGFSIAASSKFGQGPTVSGLRVASVEYWVDGKRKATVTGDPSRGWRETDRYAARLFLEEGSHVVTARVGLVEGDAPKGAKAATIYLDGVGFEVEVGVPGREFDGNLAGMIRRNQIERKGLKASASSSSNEKTKAAAAFDGVFATRWLSATSDKVPKVSATFKQPVETDTIVIAQAARHPNEKRSFDRIARMAIRINRAKEPLLVKSPNDLLSPTVVRLEEPQRIRSLEIEVLERVEGSRSAGELGIAEVSLELRD